MTAYAARTEVTAARSRAEIEDMLMAAGATSFMAGTSDGRSIVACEIGGRRILFRLADPVAADVALTPGGKRRDAAGIKTALEAERRRRWRALALAIKAKLVSVEEGIETVEQAFMAHIVMPDGLTVAEHVAPRIAAAYETGTMPPLLPSKP